MRRLREPSLSYPKKTKNPNPFPIGNRFGFLLFRGPDRIRTDDPHNANVVRSQLRYRPIFSYFVYFSLICLCSLLFWPGPCYVVLALPTELQAHELFSPHIIPQLFSFVKSFFHFFQKIFVAFPKTVSYNIFCYPSSAYSCGIGLAQ